MQIQPNSSKVISPIHVINTQTHHIGLHWLYRMQGLHSVQPYRRAPLPTNVFKGRKFYKRTCKIKEHFLQWAYDEQHLNTELRRARYITRETCLQKKQNQGKPARTPLVVNYHPFLQSLHLTTKRHLPILQVLERILIQGNLRDLLVRVALTSMPHEPPGNCPCGAPRCKTCPILVTSDEFSSHTTGKSFKVKIWASCKSSNVIYLTREM